MLGHWKIKKCINRNTNAKGSLSITKDNKNYQFKELINTNLNEKNINGLQIYKVLENKKNIIFYFNLGIDKNKIYQKFSKKSLRSSLFFCGKDLYISSLNILSQYFRTI